MAKEQDEHLQRIVHRLLQEGKRDLLAQVLKALADANPRSFDRKRLVSRLVLNIALFDANAWPSKQQHQVEMIMALIRKSRLKSADLIAPLTLLS